MSVLRAKSRRAEDKRGINTTRRVGSEEQTGGSGTVLLREGRCASKTAECPGALLQECWPLEQEGRPRGSPDRATQAVLEGLGLNGTAPLLRFSLCKC